MADSVSRTFRLLQVTDSAVGAVKHLPGVIDARRVGGGLKIAYDVINTDYQTLQEALRQLGYPPPKGRLQRLRGSWSQFKDENLRAHLEHKPACCSKPPPGASRRK